VGKGFPNHKQRENNMVVEKISPAIRQCDYQRKKQSIVIAKHLVKYGGERFDGLIDILTKYKNWRVVGFNFSIKYNLIERLISRSTQQPIP
jgi:hypothetical protein